MIVTEHLSMGWREKALADLDPLSREAFRIRKLPQSEAERNYWAREFRRIEFEVRRNARRSR